MKDRISIVVMVDAVGALSDRTLHNGNLSLVDDSSAGSRLQGTPDLVTAVVPGQVVQWTPIHVDVQTPVEIQAIEFLSGARRPAHGRPGRAAAPGGTPRSGARRRAHDGGRRHGFQRAREPRPAGVGGRRALRHDARCPRTGTGSPSGSTKDPTACCTSTRPRCCACEPRSAKGGFMAQQHGIIVLFDVENALRTRSLDGNTYWFDNMKLLGSVGSGHRAAGDDRARHPLTSTGRRRPSRC